jgi:photoactive yellow protein
MSLLTAQELFGLFQLDDAGTVLYYRTDSGEELTGTSPNTEGHNFYDEVAPFENVEEFRQRVSRFTTGEKLADSFNFDCQYQDSALLVKVLMARIREDVGAGNTNSILLHFRRAA